jgi:UDP-N-acetyl-2-amino-2-deoxyglucuronate dehydrogenase
LKKNTKFALLGCSRISSKHIEAITALADRCDLTDICDIDDDALARVQAQTGANSFRDYDDMLHSSNADCVIITTPNGLHSDHAIKAAKSGFDVLTEKPMATNVEDAEKMIEVCSSLDKRLFVVKQVRFSPSVQMIREAVAEGRFGKIYLVNLNLFWTRPQEFYDTADWRGSLEMDGGTLLNQGSHYIDIIDWLFGPVTEVSAMNATLGRDIEAEDTSVINLRLGDNSLGSISMTVLTYPKNLECSLTIIGETGTVKLGGPSLNVFEKWEFSKMGNHEESIASKDPLPTGFSHRPYYEDILNVLQNGTKPQADGHEGIKSIKIICSAIKSSKENKSIAL